MKRKLLLAALVAVGAMGGKAWAQETLDITDLYITNPSFETGDWTGWTTQTAEDTWVRNNATEGKDGTYLFNTWWHGYPIYQTVSDLPAGTYTLSALAASTGGYFTLYVNDNSSVELSKKTVQPTQENTFITCSTQFTLNEAQNVTIGVRNSNSADTYDDAFWFKTDNFKLFLNLEEGATIPDAIVTKLLSSVPTGTMSTSVKNAMDNAISTFQSNATLANYNAALEAMAAARTSIASYAAITAGIIPTNEVGNWAISTTAGALACNTWSTEGNTDGSTMTTPFIQDWAASGTALGAGKLYYRLVGLNPGEKYSVSALVRVLDESGAAVSGATFYVNNKTKDIASNGSAVTNGVAGTMNLAAEVDENGVLEIGIESASASTFNWMSIKDVTIAEYAGVGVASITLSQNAATLTTGDALTLTATVSPDNADDKTFTWASDNETVATVTAAGIISAVGAGSANITATANDGSGVSASCAITVADAVAPAYFSTEIAAEDYYVVNVATGKFLGGANNWGTQASIIEHGIPFTAALNNGTYTLDSHTYNSATDHFLNGQYIDQPSTNLYITSVGSGKFSISTADGSAFLTATAGSTVVANTAGDASNTLAQWYFISKADRDKMLAAATAENPVDATYYIKQANISRNLSAGAQNENAWSNLSTGGTQENSNFVAQVYNAAVDVVQTIEGIPNGTYTLTMQGFTSGTDVKLYANDVEVDVRANDSGATSCAAASVVFAAKSYPNTLSVTVTDHTLRIGLKGDCSSSKWLCYDNFELYMTHYIPVTAITATIEPEGDIEIGNTAQITFATTPSPASFDALTITSSNEAVATVSENGLVTAIAEGEATITIAAEMENITKTFDITVVKPAVLPTSVVLDETEIALNTTTTSATLTATVGAEGAPQAVVWTSSDEDVATVSEAGVVTAVLPGTATIRATAYGYNDVYAEATVTVTYPETVVPESSVTNDGATRYINTLGENLIKNGSFEYPNGYYGWKNGKNGDLAAANFDIAADGDNKYLRAKYGDGAGSEKSICTVWPIESGKTYVFGYKVKASTTVGDKSKYLVVSMTNSIGTEPEGGKVSKDDETVNTSWNSIAYTFTNTEGYAYVQFRARWLANSLSFDDFYLCEATTTTVGNVDYAIAAIPTTNIGTGAFQYSQDAIDAANALVQGEATVEDVQAAYNAVTTINEPKDGQLFNVVLTYGGWTYDNKAMTYIAGGRGDMGGYNIQYQEAANQNLAQAFTFTKVSGNNYKLSQIDADGVARYISTGVPYPEKNGNTAQIRTTTDASKALEVTIIPTATEGVYNLRNTEANQYIGSQDAGVFTVNSHINFNIVETSKPSIAINTTAAGWGTTILPFAVASLPTDVKAYTCAAVNGTTLTLEAVSALEANKPYIIEGAWDETLTGDAQGTALTYTAGLLTGVYTAKPAPADSYVLQNNDGKVAFYQVEEGKEPTVGANRAYLTTTTSAKARVLYFEGEDATAIATIAALTQGEVEAIYTLGGAKIQSLQKGINIVKLMNGEVKKVIVK